MKRLFSTILITLTSTFFLFANNNQEAITGVDISEVVITGNREYIPSNELPAAITTIDRESIESRFESSLLTTVTEQVPGFFNTSRGVMGYGVSTGAAGGINIRGIGGTNSAQMLVLIDGHPQYAGLMGHPIADAYHSLGVERIEVVRGPASVLYGSNAMGGVMNIITGNGTENGFSGSARAAYGSYGSLQSQAGVSYNNNRFSSNGGILYNRSNGHRENMDFEQIQGTLGIGYELTDHYSISVNANLADIESRNPGTVSAPIFNNQADISRGNISVSLDNRNSRSSGSLMMFHNFGNHKIADGNGENEAELSYVFRSEDALSGINLYETFSLFEDNHTTFGFDWFHVYGKGWFAHDDGTISSPWNKSLPAVEESSNEFAGYVNFNQRLFDRITFSAGLRFNHHSIVGSKWIPQSGITYDIDAHNNLKLMAGKGYRNPTMKDMFLFPPQNPDLKPEELVNYELAYSGIFADGKLKINANLFHIDAKNIILVQMIDGRKRNMNSGELKNSGMELAARYKIEKNISVSGNYSYLYMKYPVVAAPQHKLYADIDWSCGKFRAVSGMQYIAGLYTDTTQDAEKQENFLLWNARMVYQISDKTSIFVKGENLLNSKYEINAEYPMPGITVMSGVNLSF